MPIRPADRRRRADAHRQGVGARARRLAATAPIFAGLDLSPCRPLLVAPSDAGYLSRMAAEQIVVVTAATSGVGRAVVRRFAGPGVSLGLVARARDGLEGACREVEAAGGRALTMACDVADPDALEAVAEVVEEAYGPIDVWINNATTTVCGGFDDIEPAEFRRATDVIYHGAVWGMRAALARMLPRDRGTIVQLTSATQHAIPLPSPYCGAEHAIRGLYDSVRSELRQRGSRVHLTLVQVSGFGTRQLEPTSETPPDDRARAAPSCHPDVAADAVHWAVHHRRREVLVGPQHGTAFWAPLGGAAGAAGARLRRWAAAWAPRRR